MGTRLLEKGQALAELAVALPILIALGVVLYALLTPALGPLYLRERLLLEVRSGSSGETLALLEQSHGDLLLPPFPQETDWESSLRESRSREIPLLIHRRLFPGTAREARGDLDLGALLNRSSLPGMLDSIPPAKCRERLALTTVLDLDPAQVKREVRMMFLGGVAERTGLLDLLGEIGLDPVRVDLNVLPEGSP